MADTVTVREVMATDLWTLKSDDTVEVAADVMTEQPTTISADAPFEDAATIMHDEQINSIPVVDGKKIVGIVARTDLVRFIARTT